jgi:DNA-binding transcriptional regulator YdaS (Cro superfamily)
MSRADGETYRIRGIVVHPQTKRGLAGLRVEAWDNDLLMDDLVGSAVTGADGAFEIAFDPSSFGELFLDRRPDLYFKVFHDGRLVASTKDATLWSTGAGETPVVIEVPLAVAALADAGAPADGLRRVEGRIVFDYGLPANGLTVRLYGRGFGGTETLLGEGITDADGRYAIAYTADGATLGLEVRALDKQGPEVSLSIPRYDAAEVEVLDLVAPGTLRPLGAEYDRLIADLAKHTGGAGELGKARESGDARDLTLLHQATGWDARLIALAVLAARQRDATGLDPDVLYALYRAGLPMETRQLALAREAEVAQALERARTANVVAIDDARLGAAVKAFARFAAGARRETKAPGALSSIGELLGRSAVPREDQARFEALYFAHRGAPAELWAAARAQGIAEDSITALRVQGKLAYLTFDNAPLAAALGGELLAAADDGGEFSRAADDLGRIVDLDLYRADAWKERVQALAENAGGLEQLVPPAYEGKTADERLDAYAADLARKVRLSYPTRVVARMIETGDLSIPREKDTPLAAAFLRRAEPLGFELGRVPLAAFIQQHGASLFAEQPLESVDATVRVVKQLQRLYQITPSNQSLAVLAGLGFTSAQDVAALSRETFLDRHGERFASTAEAELVYYRAQQVGAVTREVLTMARQLQGAPPMHALAPRPERPVGGGGATVPSDGGSTAPAGGGTREQLIRHFPTLESLFGSVDFCECEHCRSVLSPAAYLVDLLRFLDPQRPEWPGFLADWARRHDGETYEQAGYRDPFTALTTRRPDLPHLRLTCENTNTVLPYIDLVNEILEYWVAHNDLHAAAVRDTGDASSAELLAEPGHVIPEAYHALHQARYPLSLPFDLWLETVRRYLEHLETPLAGVLDAMRTTDAPFSPTGAAADTARYYRAAVFAESLGIPPAEYALLTTPPPWYTLYGYGSAETALSALGSARALARRLGVTYTELVQLVRTGFLNPRLHALALLRTLGIDAEDAARYYGAPGHPALSAAERAEFEGRLAALGPDVGTWLQEAWRDGRFNGILVLSSPSGGCDLSQTTLRYLNLADTDVVARRPFDLLRLNLFVRLWRRLGWTIEETDRALQLFLSGSAAPLDWTSIGNAFRTALLHLGQLAALEDRLPASPDARRRLLTLWSPLPTTGRDALYVQLFAAGGPHQDAAFDHPLGEYLSREAWVRNHLPALQGALGLTASEIREILADAARTLAGDDLRAVFPGTEHTLETARLTIASVSLLHRYALLARGLEMPVRDLIALRRLSGIDPFIPLRTDPTVLPADEDPLAQTLRFVDAAAQVRESGLSVEDVEYLLAHRSDPVGRYRADPDAAATLTRALGAELRRIRAEHPLPPEVATPDDPGEAALLSDDVLRQELAVVLPPSAVETFLAMWTGTAEYRAEWPVADFPLREMGLAPATLAALQAAGHDSFFDVIELGREELMRIPAIGAADADRILALVAETTAGAFAGEPALRVAFDALRRVRRLTFRGVLVDTEITRLERAYGGAESTALSGVLAGVRRQAHSFFVEYLVRETAPLRGFLAADAFDTLFAPGEPLTDGLADAERRARVTRNDARLRERRRTVLRALVPVVRAQLTRQAAVRILATTLRADAPLLEALLTDARLLAEPGGGTPAPLLDAFASAAEEGVTVRYYADGTSTPIQTATLAAPATAATDSARIAGATSARFEGRLEVEHAGAYRFTAVAGRIGMEVEMRLAAFPDPVLRGVAAAADEQISGFVELRPGVSYAFTVDARALGDGAATLRVESDRLPRGSLERLHLTPAAAVERVGRARVLLAKAAQLLEGLGIGEGELRYLRTHAADFANLDLGALPTAATDERASAAALFDWFLRLAGYARLKAEMAGGTADLIGVFQAARRTEPASAPPAEVAERLMGGVCRRIAELTRRDVQTVRAAVAHLGYPVQTAAGGATVRVEVRELAGERGVRRVWEVLRVVERLGVAVAQVGDWTGIVRSAPTPEDQDRRFTIARAVRGAVRARYALQAWQRAAQPIHDGLRRLQRDALVAHVLHLHPEGFERPEQLFEYFLVDPGMEPVVQTSRLRLAISSVQLFIQRCLLSLEPHVPPDAIDAAQWAWMKRYRVWEANRKIYLYPENFLEPELRDDRTHLFRELEGALLQGEVSEDSVADAFYRYLRGLEEIARLEVVTTYQETAPHGPGILHVIARTYAQPHRYFYRRYADGTWTPWEAVGVEIEGDHVAAVVWRGRLHLFWVTFMDRPAHPPGKAESSPRELAEESSGSLVQMYVDVQLSWAEYFQGAWTGRSSGDFGEPMRARVGPRFDRREVLLFVAKEMEDGEERAVRIELGNPLWRAFRVVSKNGRPSAGWADIPGLVPYPDLEVRATQHRGSGTLAVMPTYARADRLPPPDTRRLPILRRGGTFSLTLSGNAMDPESTADENRVRPFFYQDDQHTFFVEPAITEVPLAAFEGLSTGDQLVSAAATRVVQVFAGVPLQLRPVPSDPMGPYARHEVLVRQDWAADPAAQLRFDGVAVGARGRLAEAELQGGFPG